MISACLRILGEAGHSDFGRERTLGAGVQIVLNPSVLWPSAALPELGVAGSERENWVFVGRAGLTPIPEKSGSGEKRKTSVFITSICNTFINVHSFIEEMLGIM